MLSAALIEGFEVSPGYVSVGVTRKVLRHVPLLVGMVEQLLKRENPAH